MRAKEFARHIFEQVKSNWYIPVTEHQVYSTAEQKIGVWMDQKPLYRKVVDCGAMPNASIKTVAHGIANIDKYIDVTGYFYNDAGDEDGAFMPFAMGSPNTSGPIASSFVGIWAQTKTTLSIGTGNDRSLYKGFAIIKYTKTTDTATSPKVPYEPLHEWSTEEKLVGYWIDGKAVYEKTVDCGALSAGSQNIAHGITNLDTVISYNGTCIRSDDNRSIPTSSIQNNAARNVGIAGVTSQNIIIHVGSEYISTNVLKDCYVTLRYTKTT